MRACMRACVCACLCDAGYLKAFISMYALNVLTYFYKHIECDGGGRVWKRVDWNKEWEGKGRGGRFTDILLIMISYYIRTAQNINNQKFSPETYKWYLFPPLKYLSNIDILSTLFPLLINLSLPATVSNVHYMTYQNTREK